MLKLNPLSLFCSPPTFFHVASFPSPLSSFSSTSESYQHSHYLNSNKWEEFFCLLLKKKLKVQESHLQPGFIECFQVNPHVVPYRVVVLSFFNLYCSSFSFSTSLIFSPPRFRQKELIWSCWKYVVYVIYYYENTNKFIICNFLVWFHF